MHLPFMHILFLQFDKGVKEDFGLDVFNRDDFLRYPTTTTTARFDM